MNMTPIDPIIRSFRSTLAENGLHSALGVINATTDYRFTGVYRFEHELVVNVVLFDRENPELKVGEDVRLMESYCRITAVMSNPFGIDDAPADDRLDGHAARDAVQSYLAVLLRNPDGSPLGTLCHFDVRPRPFDDAMFEILDAARADVEQAVLGVRGLPDREPGVYRIANFNSQELLAE